MFAMRVQAFVGIFISILRFKIKIRISGALLPLTIQDKKNIIIKIIFFQKSVKIGSWGGFGPILDPDSNSA